MSYPWLMRAMRLHALGSWDAELESAPSPTTPAPVLRLDEVPVPRPSPGEVLLEVRACGVCRTELDEAEGRAPPSALPRTLGHQVVGRVVEVGRDVEPTWVGRRVGVGWIFGACGACEWCVAGYENLCPEFRATGRDAEGGYAEFMVAPAAFVHELPDTLTDTEVAPLLCAGAIGFRSLRLTGLIEPPASGQTRRATRLGLMGFGASAHLVLRMIRTAFPEIDVYVFARNDGERVFARELGAVWAGDIAEPAPEALHAVIDTTPAHGPLLESLRKLAPGGRLVVNAISKEARDLSRWLDFDFHRDLWLEREVKSVANVTRKDVRDFLALAASARFLPEVTEYPLEEAERALLELKRGQVRGAKVLRISG